VAKILVVDDDAFNLKLAVTVLTQAGHEVLSADGGEAGTALALAAVPDLVLMDVQMPGLDGVAALQRLRADARTASLKVVALTALAMKGDRERLLLQGFDGYLEKPIRYQAFLDSVAALLHATSPPLPRE
jgi:two-component system cell cycle response regulator DivK